jgi:hypothetical protein
VPASAPTKPLILSAVMVAMAVRRFVNDGLSYPVFMPKPSTHRMHDSGSLVPHIRPKVLTDNQIS